MRALLVLLLLAPGATALAALPPAAEPNEVETRLLLRLTEGSGLVRVEADGPVLVALVPPGEEPGEWTPAPADLAPTPGDWHGLADVVELVARREDPSRPVVLSVAQGDSGVAWEWSAQATKPPRELSWASTLVLLSACGLVFAAGLALAVAYLAARRRRRGRGAGGEEAVTSHSSPRAR